MFTVSRETDGVTSNYENKMERDTQTSEKV